MASWIWKMQQDQQNVCGCQWNLALAMELCEAVKGIFPSLAVWHYLFIHCLLVLLKKGQTEVEISNGHISKHKLIFSYRACRLKSEI